MRTGPRLTMLTMLLGTVSGCTDRATAVILSDAGSEPGILPLLQETLPGTAPSTTYADLDF